MAVKAQIRIPKHNYNGLAKLLHVSDEQLQKLFSVFEEQTPTLSHEKYLAHVIQKVDFDPDDVAEMLDVMITLYSVRFSINLDIPDFVDVLCRALEDTGFEPLIPDNGDWSLFRNRLTTFLSFSQSIGIVSKSSFIFFQHTNIFQEARIFTDVRPVFDSDLEETPVGGLVVHKLKITYMQSGEQQEIFLALGADDIRAIREVLDRAELKEKSISNFLKASSILTLESEGE